LLLQPAKRRAGDQDVMMIGLSRFCLRGSQHSSEQACREP